MGRKEEKLKKKSYFERWNRVTHGKDWSAIREEHIDPCSISQIHC